MLRIGEYGPLLKDRPQSDELFHHLEKGVEFFQGKLHIDDFTAFRKAADEFVSAYADWSHLRYEQNEPLDFVFGVDVNAQFQRNVLPQWKRFYGLLKFFEPLAGKRAQIQKWVRQIKTYVCVGLNAAEEKKERHVIARLFSLNAGMKYSLKSVSFQLLLSDYERDLRHKKRVSLLTIVELANSAFPGTVQF